MYIWLAPSITIVVGGEPAIVYYLMRSNSLSLETNDSEISLSRARPQALHYYLLVIKYDYFENNFDSLVREIKSLMIVYENIAKTPVLLHLRITIA